MSIDAAKLSSLSRKCLATRSTMVCQEEKLENHNAGGRPNKLNANGPLLRPPKRPAFLDTRYCIGVHTQTIALRRSLTSTNSSETPIVRTALISPDTNLSPPQQRTRGTPPTTIMPTMWLSDTQSKCLHLLLTTATDSADCNCCPEVGVAFCSGGRYDHHPRSHHPPPASIHTISNEKHFSVSSMALSIDVL